MTAIVAGVFVTGDLVVAARAYELLAERLVADGFRPLPVAVDVPLQLLRGELASRSSERQVPSAVPLRSVSRMMNAKEAAQVLEVGVRAVTKRASKLGGTKLGNRWVFDPEVIERNRRVA